MQQYNKILTQKIYKKENIIKYIIYKIIYKINCEIRIYNIYTIQQIIIYKYINAK